MSQKHMPRLGSAIASTILSVFSAVSLVGVDKAQAAVLTYAFTIEHGFHVGEGFFKVDTSSLTGIGYEEVFVSEGTLNTAFYVPNGYWHDSGDHLYLQKLGSIDEFYPYSGATAKFYQGDFLGLIEERSDYGGYKESYAFASWIFDLNLTNAGMWRSSFSGYLQTKNAGDPYGLGQPSRYTYQVDDAEVFYTLVPEPLTSGGTALALAGLSWLKHKKKRAA
jgi:hypothetical protein